MTFITDTLHRAVHAAMEDAANRAIRPRFQHLGEGDIIEKAADDLVTIADRESELILAEALAKILPEAAIVGEEAVFADPSVADTLGGPLTWIIDPIDGTHNFAHGHPPFGVLIALAADGVGLGGWILDVPSGRFCQAAAGGGAFIDGQRIVAKTTGETPPVAAISVMFADPARRAAIQSHIAPFYRLADIPRCAAEQYPRLVLGENDVSIFERTYSWDHAAGVLFLNEAGGKAARANGDAYRVDDNRKGLVAAASPALWDGLAARLAEVEG